MSCKRYVGIELTEGEVLAFAHISGIEKEEIMGVAEISDNDALFKFGVFEGTLRRIIEKLEKDIEDIERGGGDHHYSFLTIGQAKDLLAKLVLATK